MTSAASSLTDRMERVIDGVTKMAVDARNQWRRLAGPRPMYWGEGDTLDQLERYLDVRDDRAAAAAIIAEQTALYGRDAGEMDLAAELIRMEKLLQEHGGGPTVRAAMLLKRIRKAEPVLKQIERIDALPEYEVVGALPGYDEMSALTALAEGGVPEFQPVIQTPADAMPQNPSMNGGPWSQ